MDAARIKQDFRPYQLFIDGKWTAPSGTVSIPVMNPATGEQLTTVPDANAVQTATKIDTPVVVRSNSWVELRSPSGDVLAQTYLRAGESYVVPAGIAYRVIDAR